MCARAWSAALALLAAAVAAAAALLPLHAERLRAAVGGYVVMNCHLDFPFGNEIPYHLQWDKDGEVIYSWFSSEGRARTADRWGGRVARALAAGLGGGAINVSAVRDTDAGLYRCRVSFPNRSPPTRNNGTFYYLDVEGGDLIGTPPMNVTVVEGERAELECLPRSAAAEVQWLREGAPLAEQPELAARAELPPNGSLVLRAVAADAGVFACRVTLGVRSQLAAAYLDVQYKAKVVYAPEELYFPFGKPASLDCHFSANPPLTNLRWEKDGFLFDPYNVPGVFYSRNGSLLFNRVDESHAGMYSCTAYNALGSAGASPRVRVRVQRGPRLRARPPPLSVARLGAAAALPCAADRDDDAAPPALAWTRKDGSPLPVGRHSLDGGNLTIVDIAEEDRGVYVCSASNEAASVSAETELLIENVPPRAPHNLTARALRDALHLSWAPGHNGLTVEYIVWYRERAATEWRTMKLLSRGVTEATLVGLRARTQYELRVLAQDHIGDGLFSKPLFISTLDEEGGEEAGEGVTALPMGEDALAVSARLLDEGALVRWQAAGGSGERSQGAEGEGEGTALACTFSWYQDDRLLFTARTHHDYALVSTVEEGGEYYARVQCDGAAGSAALHVPAWSRLRAAAAAAAALLLLAAAVAALLLARRCRCFGGKCRC